MLTKPHRSLKSASIRRRPSICTSSGKTGARAEGFAWSHYAGYQWTDEGERERLVVIFGGRAVEIEGHNLGVLITEIREGQLNASASWRAVRRHCWSTRSRIAGRLFRV